MTRPHLPQTDPLEVTRQLYRQAVVLHSPADIPPLVDFVARFRRFSVFNTALIHVQRPGAVLLASAIQWARLGRGVRAGALPVIVLAPFGPVQFLFDEADTTGRPLTVAERAALEAPGPAPRANWEQTVEGAKALGVVVEAGRPQPGDDWRLAQHTDRCHARGEGRYISWEVSVDGSLDTGRRFLRLTHELGHIYCGHLGGHPAGAWRTRRDLPVAEREAEAALVCHLVMARAGRSAPDLAELQAYMAANDVTTLDAGAVISAADFVESRRATGRSRRKPQKPGDALPGQMGMFQ